jgi:hypothetical protein
LRGDPMTDKMSDKIDLTLSDFLVAIENIRKDLNSKILELPDNPKINRFSESPRCFTISSSDLGHNWTPFYHDFKLQYQKLVEVINTARPENLCEKMKGIIKSGVLHDGTHNYKFNPVVIGHLKSIF